MSNAPYYLTFFKSAFIFNSLLEINDIHNRYNICSDELHNTFLYLMLLYNIKNIFLEYKKN